MIRIAVCDDEKYYCNRIHDFIKRYFSEKYIEHRVDIFTSGIELCERLEMNEIDILFLDVEMEPMNGIELAQRWRKLHPNTHIVYITAFIAYAMEGYKVDAIRYILKDEREFDFSLTECLDTILKRMKNQQHIELKFVEGKMRILPIQMEYIESKLHKLIFHMVDDKSQYTIYDKLESLEEILCKESFGRVHQSYLVNIHHVCKYERYKLTMQSGDEIPIPHEKYNIVVSEILNLKGVV